MDWTRRTKNAFQTLWKNSTRNVVWFWHAIRCRKVHPRQSKNIVPWSRSWHTQSKNCKTLRWTTLGIHFKCPLSHRKSKCCATMHEEILALVLQPLTGLFEPRKRKKAPVLPNRIFGIFQWTCFPRYRRFSKVVRWRFIWNRVMHTFVCFFCLKIRVATLRKIIWVLWKSQRVVFWWTSKVHKFRWKPSSKRSMIRKVFRNS